MFAEGLIKILESNKKFANLKISNDLFNLLCGRALEKKESTVSRFASSKRKRRSAISNKIKCSKNAEEFKIICHLCSEKFHFEKMGLHLSKSHNVERENIERNVEMCHDFTESLKNKNSDIKFKENTNFVWVSLDANSVSLGNIDEDKIDQSMVEIRKKNELKCEASRKVGFNSMEGERFEQFKKTSPIKSIAQSITRMRLTKVGNQNWGLSQSGLMSEINIHKSADKIIKFLSRFQVFIEVQINPPGKVRVEGFSFSLTDCSFLTDNFLFAIQSFVQTAKYILLKCGTIKNYLAMLKSFVHMHQECLVVAHDKHQPEMDKVLRNSVVMANELNKMMNEMDLEGISKKKVDLDEMLADKKLFTVKEFAIYMQFLIAKMISILDNADGADGEQNELYFSCWLNFHLLT